MGGYGSGRWHDHHKKTPVEDCLAISTASLRKERLLDHEASGVMSWHKHEASLGFSIILRGASPILLLRYRANDEPVTFAIPLQATQPHFGGVRWWFICPLIKNSTPCCRRVGKLYIPPRYKYFGCRHCYELSYRSRQEYDKRIANISLEQIEYINQQMDSIPTSQQVRWAMLYFKAAEYNWRWLDRIGKRLSEPDETKIYETMK